MSMYVNMEKSMEAIRPGGHRCGNRCVDVDVLKASKSCEYVCPRTRRIEERWVGRDG